MESADAEAATVKSSGRDTTPVETSTMESAAATTMETTAAVETTTTTVASCQSCVS